MCHCVRLKCLEIAHRYYNIFDHKKIFSPLINNNDFNVIRSLKKDNSILITRPDKGKGVVILDRVDYITKLHNLLSDTSKYKHLPNTDILKHITTIEDKLNRLHVPSHLHHLITKIFIHQAQ